MSHPTARIRHAAPGDGARLKELTAASKAHWGYDAARVRGWVETLDFSEARLGADELYVADVAGRVVGWCEVIPPLDGVCVLDHLWIEPEWIGRELGSALFQFGVQRARDLGAGMLEWESEPNAVGFYERMGGRRLRETTSEWGRPLTVMGLDL
jgi:GNAT superfamily N-acetyltransferase